MTNRNRRYFAIASGLVAVGAIIALVSFILSGFNPAIFTTQIDMRDNKIILGGIKIDEPRGIFPLEQIAELGNIEIPAHNASDKASTA